MKQKKILFAGAILVLVLGVFFVRSRSLHTQNFNFTRVASEKSAASLGSLLRAPRDAKQVADSKVVPTNCAPFFEQLQSLDLLRAESQNLKLSYQQLPMAPENCEITNMAYQMALQQFQAICQASAPGRQGSDVISEECADKLFILRSSITKMLLKDTPLSEITDLSQLTDLLFAEFFSSGTTADSMPDTAKVRAVAERMIELNPNLYGAAKVSNFTDVLDGLMSASKKDEAGAEAAWERAAKSLARAKELNPNDPEVAVSETAIRTHGFKPEKMTDYADELIAKNPDNPVAWLYRAHGMWNQNQRNESIAALRQAIALDPENAGYRETLQELLKPSASQTAFHHNYRIGISSSDFGR